MSLVLPVIINYKQMYCSVDNDLNESQNMIEIVLRIQENIGYIPRLFVTFINQTSSKIIVSHQLLYH